LEGSLTTVPQLREIVTRLRRLMPMDRDVQAVCLALQRVLDLEPKTKDDKRAEKLAVVQRTRSRREYIREWMARYRMTQPKTERPLCEGCQKVRPNKGARLCTTCRRKQNHKNTAAGDAVSSITQN
jgi:hypothetical protein